MVVGKCGWTNCEVEKFDVGKSKIMLESSKSESLNRSWLLKSAIETFKL